MASYSPAASAPLPGSGHSNPLAETLNSAFSSISDTLFQLPGSAIILRYIKSSYQGVSNGSQVLVLMYYSKYLIPHLTGPHSKSPRANPSHLCGSDYSAESNTRWKQWVQLCQADKKGKSNKGPLVSSPIQLTKSWRLAGD